MEYYEELYRSHLFAPLCETMKKSTGSSVVERCLAIKHVADRSLALTAKGSCWSAALGQRLVDSPAPPSPIQPLNASPLNSPHRRFPFKLNRRLHSCKFSSSLKSRNHFLKSFRPRRRLHTRMEGRICKVARSRQRRSFKQVRRQILKATQPCSSSKAEVKTRVKILQGLVPGGKDMSPSLLLLETADYLMFLKLQVDLLQSLAANIDKSSQECC